MNNYNAKIIITNFIFVIIIYYLLFIISPSIYAQQISLSLSPILTELAIKPGFGTVLRYKLRNPGDPAIVKIRVLPFEASDVLGNIEIKNSSEGPILFDVEHETVKLEEVFFLKNSDSVEFPLKITVPEEAPQRDYYFTLIAESQPPPAQEGSASIRAKISFVAHLLITVTNEGEVEIKPKINLFEVTPKNKIRLFGLKINLFNSFDQIPLVLVIENKGKNLIKPQGEIILKGPLWQSRKFKIKPQIVLAKSQRLLNIDSSAPDKSLLLPGTFLGSYKISTTLSFGEGTPTLFASTSFLVLPIKLTIFSTIVITLVLLLWRKFKKD